MSDPAPDLAAYIAAGTAMLGIPVRPEWQDAIRTHLDFSLTVGRLVLAFPLPDEADPASVFTA